jgi:hypothetical protein
VYTSVRRWGVLSRRDMWARGPERWEFVSLKCDRLGAFSGLNE